MRSGDSWSGHPDRLTHVGYLLNLKRFHAPFSMPMASAPFMPLGLIIVDDLDVYVAALLSHLSRTTVNLDAATRERVYGIATFGVTMH